ncbi:MAG: J domain-containing protein [Acidimicrobiia bacterium]|nr:J domain-containing protein [Acidimicrobiia bacterium]
MTPDEARSVLGLDRTASVADAVASHRRLQLRHHPDRTDDPDATALSARLNRALAVLRAEAQGPPPVMAERSPAPVTTDMESIADTEPVDVRIESGSVFVAAPADETFLRLLEAASVLGDVGHLDLRLGLLELLVRPEGGPTCSVLFTLQGRALGTEVFAEMESIEAAPTPPLEPVLRALADAVATGTPPPGFPT